MAISDQEKAVLFQSATSNYIFDYCFKQANNGASFDIDSWMEELDKLTEHPMFSMSKETMGKISDHCSAEGLNKFAMKKESSILV